MIETLATFTTKIFYENLNLQKQPHPQAAWIKGRYVAENLRVVFHCDDGEFDYVSDWHTLDAVIGEAESLMLRQKFGMATIFDGKYRLCVITKKYRDEDVNSNLTNYGRKCKAGEKEQNLSYNLYR